MTTTVSAGSADLATSFRAIPTTIIGDSQERFGLPAGLHPMWNSEPFAGEAFTVLTVPGDNLGIHQALSHIRPGQVLVVDGGGYEARALIGDLVAEKARALRVAALIIDGAIRDVLDIAKIGVPVYARSVIPAGPWKNGPFRVGAPVSVGGVVVSPGDLIVGDTDGLAVISPARAEEVLATCHDRLAQEEASRAKYKELKPND
ncbi:RraA family protein [Pseudarthrobacter sp. NamE5]|uniref:RraA family protein n=1 Tax=Pseudarthrobacter sp. NamE5 TaxID=2576839 RepID=UPI00110BBF68|nr:methyltransferase [Pseudarthrobacter sp. NamE5]TLM88274.1 methyltransferase [Pseudarthrobacter sp. NamE5]